MKNDVTEKPALWPTVLFGSFFVLLGVHELFKWRFAAAHHLFGYAGVKAGYALMEPWQMFGAGFLMLSIGLWVLGSSIRRRLKFH